MPVKSVNMPVIIIIIIIIKVVSCNNNNNYNNNNNNVGNWKVQESGLYYNNY